jgi:hypothetical protein
MIHGNSITLRDVHQSRLEKAFFQLGRDRLAQTTRNNSGELESRKKKTDLLQILSFFEVFVRGCGFLGGG